MEVSQPGQKISTTQLINRELSWLAFNDRVLEEAQDSKTPLLERLKFVSIVSSNLDEFFMIRVAGLERKVKAKPGSKEVDGINTDDLLYQIRDWALDQKTKQGVVLRELLQEIRKKGLYLQTHIGSDDSDLIGKCLELIPEIEFFKGNLSQLASGKIYLFFRLKTRFVIASIPDRFDRLIELKPPVARAQRHFVLAEELVLAGAQSYFANEPVVECFPFKIIRDADVKVDPNLDPEETLAIIEKALESRARLPIVRLEIDAPNISDGALLLASKLKLHTRSVYRYDTPLDLKVLWKFEAIEGFDNLRFPQHKSSNLKLQIPDLVSLVRRKDILFHHPYDSFETIVQLLQAAAVDPQVKSVFQTLYRTNSSSPIVDALIASAKNGKEVSVYVELRARFDESRNIDVVKALKKGGVKVLQGFPEKKVHCKLTLINREEDGKIQSYVHVGTGNYNPSTARIYTDLGILTANEAFGKDAQKFFAAVATQTMFKKFDAFVAAPTQLHSKLMDWIEEEIKRAAAGGSARIVAKMNALVDPQLCQKLYKASQAGVKIDLIVRGACSLRPGVPGLSENVRVISIVDRFLEHSRIYYFENAGDPRIYLSSADWMPRNLYQRLEVAFPILDLDLKVFVRDVILGTYLKDNVKARRLLPSGEWERIQPAQGEPSLRAQDVFSKLAANQYKGTTLFGRFKK